MARKKKSHLLAFKVLLISLTGTICHPRCSLFYLSPEHLGGVTSHPSQRPLTQGQAMWFLHPIPTSSFSRAAGWAGEVPAARPCQHCLAWPVMFYRGMAIHVSRGKASWLKSWPKWSWGCSTIDLHRLRLCWQVWFLTAVFGLDSFSCSLSK